MNKQKIERETVRLFETIRPVRSFKMIPSLFQKIAEVNSNLFFESEKKPCKISSFGVRGSDRLTK